MKSIITHGYCVEVLNFASFLMKKYPPPSKFSFVNFLNKMNPQIKTNIFIICKGMRKMLQHSKIYHKILNFLQSNDFLPCAYLKIRQSEYIQKNKMPTNIFSTFVLIHSNKNSKMITNLIGVANDTARPGSVLLINSGPKH